MGDLVIHCCDKIVVQLKEGFISAQGFGGLEHVLRLCDFWA